MTVRSLSSSGDGVGHVDNSGPVIFVPNTVPGDRIRAKITHLKRNYAYAQLEEILDSSPHRVRPPCIVADKCGGCQWLAVDYPLQLKSKQEQVQAALERIGKFDSPVVKEIIAAPNSLAYRNKATYPLAMSPDKSRVKAGYYQRGSHKIINLNQCPVQDKQFNPLLAELKQDIQAHGWSIYDETTHQGSLRHLGFRAARRTGELLITLVSTDQNLPQLEDQAKSWVKKYSNVVGVNLNLNSERTNRIFGSQTKTLAGKPYITEIFAGLKFQIESTTFFQVFTEQAEAILYQMVEALQLTGTETVIDAYCGVGTLTLPLAQKVESVLGIETHSESLQSAKLNAQRNQIQNVRFRSGNVEQGLADSSQTPDILILDPPRKGCSEGVIQQIKRLLPGKIMYLSCNPSTLARDLGKLCHNAPYELKWVQPADFFPQTSHVESLAFVTLHNS